MRDFLKRNLVIFALALILGTGSAVSIQPGLCLASPWKTLEQGLELATFQAGQKSKFGDSTVTVLRIDPDRYELKLINSARHGKKSRTAGRWCEEMGLLAAINASMYRQDHLTSTGLMKDSKYWNNRKLNPKDYNSMLAFNPVRPGIPKVRMLDLKCDDYKKEMKGYNTLIQNIRLLTCKGGNAWSKKPRYWSTTAVGLDHKGRILFIHCRSPYRVHDLINILKKLPLGLERGMYVEGGPEASLSIRAGEYKADLCGSFETGFNENDDNKVQWPIPNIIGVVRAK